MHLQNHNTKNTAIRHLMYFLLGKKYCLKFSWAISWRVHQYDIQSNWDSHKWLSYDLSLEGEKQCYIFLCTSCSAAYNDNEFTKTNFLQNIDTWFCTLHITKACTHTHTHTHIVWVRMRALHSSYTIFTWMQDEVWSLNLRHKYVTS